jgi:hypothetical protein
VIPPGWRTGSIEDAVEPDERFDGNRLVVGDC